MIVLIGLLIGLIIGLFTNVTIPAALIPYLAISTLVGVEALSSSYISILRKEFAPGRFLIEFLANLLIAGLLAALGAQLEYDFALVIAVVFAYRIFRNVSFLSRHFYQRLSAWQKTRRKTSEPESRQL